MSQQTVAASEAATEATAEENTTHDDGGGNGEEEKQGCEKREPNSSAAHTSEVCQRVHLRVEASCGVRDSDRRDLQ